MSLAFEGLAIGLGGAVVVEESSDERTSACETTTNGVDGVEDPLVFKLGVGWTLCR